MSWHLIDFGAGVIVGAVVFYVALVIAWTS